MGFVLSVLLLAMAGCQTAESPSSEPRQEPPVQSMPAQPPQEAASMKDEDTLRIRLSFADGEAIVLLQDNPTSQSLLHQLPVTVTLDDFAGAEKIAYLPQKLSTEGAPRGYDPVVGDFTCYGPWGNVAIFYGDQPYAAGLIPMGSFETGLDLIAAIDSDTEVSISRIA